MWSHGHNRFITVERDLGEYSTMYLSVCESFPGCALCQNSPCFQLEDTIEIVLALWPRNSWLSVWLNTRVTLLMGWWKPSWCQCWIHSDMFMQQPRITPALTMKVCASACAGYHTFFSGDINISKLCLSDKQSYTLPYILLIINI